MNSLSASLKLRVISIILITSFVSTGCMRLKGNTVFEYVPSLPKGRIPATVTIEQFEDLRSEWERKQTKDVEPVATKVTRKVYDDFKDSELFSQIFAGESEASDILIKGRIYQFYWKNRFKWYLYVPYLNVIVLFGVPAGQFKGEVKLAIDLVSKQSGQLIASYEEYSLKEDTYSGYRSFWGMTAGTETSEAFRVAVDNIKERILQDKQKILAAVK